MAKLKINFQDLAFAFLNDDPDIDPHINLETGELIDNSSNYYGTSVTKYSMAGSGDESDIESVEEGESAAPAALEEETKTDKEEEEGYDEIADFDKFIKVKPLSLKGHQNVIQEFVMQHELSDKKEFKGLKYIKDFEYMVKKHSGLGDKWIQYKNEKLRFIASRWLEVNKVRADLV